MGYRVKDIELEEKNNRGVVEIEAKHGSQEHEILLGYPNLNVIKIEKDSSLLRKLTYNQSLLSLSFLIRRG